MKFGFYLGTVQNTEGCPIVGWNATNRDIVERKTSIYFLEDSLQYVYTHSVRVALKIAQLGLGKMPEKGP